MWCAGKELLLSYYPNTIKQNAIFIIHGFGKGYEIAEVYKIPDFILSDGKNEIHFSNMVVAVINKDYPFDIILSYSLFNKMNISIDTYTSRNGTHEVIPNIKINSIENRYHVGTIALADASKREKILKTLRISNINILDDIYIFSQE